MALVLVIDPALAHPDTLRRLEDLAAHELVLAASLDEGLGIISRQIPDLVVFPLACTEPGKERIIARLCALRDIGDPRSLAIPLRASMLAGDADSPGHWFYWFRPPGAATRTELRAELFAEQIGNYLARGPDDDPAAETDSTPPWRSFALRLAARVPAAARAIGARLRRPRRERPTVPLPRFQRSARRQSLVHASLLAAIVTATASLSLRTEWFTPKPEETTTGHRAQVRSSAAVSADAKRTVARRTGQLSVTSTPAGAIVAIDGRTHGVTPLLIADLPAGRHAVTFESTGGTVQSTVDVKANQTTTLEESIYPGWLALFAPIELEVRADGRVLRFDERHQALLPPGRHELALTSRELGYRESRVVEVKPGEVTTLSIVPPGTTLTVAAAGPAEVWLDGASLGTAPVIDVPLELGTHEVVVRRSAGPEQRRTITATSAPIRLDFDLGSRN